MKLNGVLEYVVVILAASGATWNSPRGKFEIVSTVALLTEPYVIAFVVGATVDPSTMVETPVDPPTKPDVL